MTEGLSAETSQDTTEEQRRWQDRNIHVGSIRVKSGELAMQEVQVTEYREFPDEDEQN